MKLNAYLTFNGQCEQAFQFYAKALYAEIALIQRYADSPMSSQCSPESGHLIMHARLDIHGQTLMGCDHMPGDNDGKFEGFSVSLNINDVELAERLFENLSEQSKNIMMPLQKTFWAQRFGMIKDQFGVTWMINCE